MRVHPICTHGIVPTAALGGVLALTGCACTPVGPYGPQVESERDVRKSERLSSEGASLVRSDPSRAEVLLREALTADLYNGPAHNNLGVIYLNRGDLFSAASEFEWSRKLMPGSPDPRLNLALTLERAGRTSEAIETYRTAMEVYPGYIQSMQAIARLQLRAGTADGTTREYLREIAMRGDDASWRAWAGVMLAGSPQRTGGAGLVP